MFWHQHTLKTCEHLYLVCHSQVLNHTLTLSFSFQVLSRLVRSALSRIEECRRSKAKVKENGAGSDCGSTQSSDCGSSQSSDCGSSQSSDCGSTQSEESYSEKVEKDSCGSSDDGSSLWPPLAPSDLLGIISSGPLLNIISLLWLFITSGILILAKCTNKRCFHSIDQTKIILPFGIELIWIVLTKILIQFISLCRSQKAHFGGHVQFCDPVIKKINPIASIWAKVSFRTYLKTQSGDKSNN